MSPPERTRGRGGAPCRTGAVTVIGCDGSPLRPAAHAALASATCVVGAARHLDTLSPTEGVRRVVTGDVRVAVEAARTHDGDLAILSSGDPAFFGLVRTLRAHGVVPRVLPAVSSVAQAFARLGLPWEDALVLSAHGRDPRAALAAALAHPKVAVLTAPGTAEPERFAPELLRAGRAVYVAERLGSPDERIARVDDPGADGFAHPNVLVAFDEGRAVGDRAWLAGHQGAPERWALPEAAFAHRGSMITKAEVRAFVLARLAPRPGVAVWDVGAGSGSVAVECARFGAYAVAFERCVDQCARIRANAAAHGAYVDVVEGSAPASFEGRTGADAVFLGGGGVAVLDAALRSGAPRRVVAALTALDRVRPVRDVLVTHGYAADGTALQASRLADLPSGSLRLAAANPVFVVWGER